MYFNTFNVHNTAEHVKDHVSNSGFLVRVRELLQVDGLVACSSAICYSAWFGFLLGQQEQRIVVDHSSASIRSHELLTPLPLVQTKVLLS